jgi:L-seryl-tRNA(Ser) seleniumtransferase
MSKPLDPFARYGLSHLVNASGTETVFGASPVSPEVVAAMAAILPHSVDMAELQTAASRVIARVTGAEAGFVTGCSSAGIVIAAAASMTGLDLGCIERLPDTTGMRNEVLIQKGHVVNYGSSITGDLRLSGARVIEIGAAAEAGLYQLEAALSANTAAAVYVISHHCVQTGMIALAPFAAACHDAGVPVIVDAAAEYGWRGFLEAGADLVIFSAQKAIGGPTAGVIAGRRELVRACYAQQRGIGRPLKAGKEAVMGTIAALERWASLDHGAVEAAVEARAQLALSRLAELPGLRASVVRDETGNPFSRVFLALDAAATGLAAHDLARALARGAPRILLRSLYADRGILQMDIRRMDDATLEMVCGRIAAVLRSPPVPAPAAAPADQSAAAVLRWLAEESVPHGARVD